jgi:HK97 family phage major capsid protein
MRSNILALRQRKADLTKQGRAILAVAEKERRELTESEESAHYKTLKALEGLEQELIAEESRLAGERVAPAFVDDNMAFAVAARGEPLPENPFGPRRRKFCRAGQKSWAEVFGPPRGNGGFKSLEEFLHAVRVSGEIFDPRLHQSLTEDIPSQGGFLVPEEYAAIVLQTALEDAIVMKRAQMWPMKSETLKIPGNWDYDHSAGTLFGGIRAIWYNELQALDEQDIKTRLIQLSAHKLGILSNASSELLEDGFMFESVLTSSMQAAAQFFLDQAFFFGDGTKQPKGILSTSNPALVVVPANPTTPNFWISFEDVLNMFKSMAPACRMRAEWVFSDSLIPALYKMQNVVKNVAGTENVGGSSVPLFMPDDSGGGTLIGRPVTFTEKFKPAGSVGDAAFIAFDQYAIGMRREINLRRSLEAGFLNDSIWWRLTVRTDGQSTWSSSLTETNGMKVSPFVTLAARGGSTTTSLDIPGMIGESSKTIEAPSAPAVVKPHHDLRRH